MKSGKPFKTVIGDIAFDKKGDITRPDYTMYMWKKDGGGKITYVENSKPPPSAETWKGRLSGALFLFAARSRFGDRRGPCMSRFAFPTTIVRFDKRDARGRIFSPRSVLTRCTSHNRREVSGVVTD